MTRSTVGYVRAIPVLKGELSVWEVFCVDCNESIGTMHPKTIQEAIFRNLSRGGIKCPICRDATCENCGVNGYLARGEPYPLFTSSGWKRAYRLCGLCLDEAKENGHNVKMKPGGDTVNR